MKAARRTPVTVLVAALGSLGLLGCGGKSNASGAEPNPSTDVSCGGASGLITLATEPQNGGAIVVDANNVYWLKGTDGSLGPVAPTPDGQVFQCAKCGCGGKPIVLASGQFINNLSAGALAVDATSVYWSNGNVMKVPIGGGEVTTLAVAQAGAIAVDKTSVYWADTAAIMKISIGGGSPTTLVAAQAGPIAIDATNVYWGDGGAGTIMKAPIGGGNATTLAGAETSPGSLTIWQSPSAIAVDATNVYWTNFSQDSTDATVMKIPIAGGGVTTLASGLQGPYALAVDTSSVYWTSNFAVMKGPIGGGSPTTLSPTNASAAAYGIAVDGASVYWTEMISGAVLKLTPK
jgi:hypothetical protein